MADDADKEPKVAGEEGEDGNDDVEAEAQVDFKPLIEVLHPPACRQPARVMRIQPLTRGSDLPASLHGMMGSRSMSNVLGHLST